MRLLVSLLFLVLFAAPVHAKCQDRKHRTHAKTIHAAPEKPAKTVAKSEPCPKPCPPPAPVPAVVEEEHGNDFKSGFEVVAGFRWDREQNCPTKDCPTPSGVHQVDPAFVGLQQRVPINEYYTLQFRIDRDVFDHGEFVEAPHWNGAVSLNWAPWR